MSVRPPRTRRSFLCGSSGCSEGERLVSGSFRVLPGEAVIGKDLAADLGVGVGDRIRVVTGIEQDSARSDSAPVAPRKSRWRETLAPMPNIGSR